MEEKPKTVDGVPLDSNARLIPTSLMGFYFIYLFIYC